jgi:hypothetical protein
MLFSLSVRLDVTIIASSQVFGQRTLKGASMPVDWPGLVLLSAGLLCLLFGVTRAGFALITTYVWQHSHRWCILERASQHGSFGVRPERVVCFSLGFLKRTGTFLVLPQAGKVLFPAGMSNTDEVVVRFGCKRLQKQTYELSARRWQLLAR